MTSYISPPSFNVRLLLQVTILSLQALQPLMAETRLRRFAAVTDLTGVDANNSSIRSTQVKGSVDLPLDWELTEYLGEVVMQRGIGDPSRMDYGSSLGSFADVKIRFVANQYPTLEHAYRAKPLQMDAKEVPFEKTSSDLFGGCPSRRAEGYSPEPPPGIFNRAYRDDRIAPVPFPGETVHRTYLLWLSKKELAYVDVTIGYVEPFGDTFNTLSQEFSQIQSSLVFETGREIHIQGFDGSDRKHLPLTFCISVLEGGKPVRNTPVGLQFDGVRCLQNKFATWTGQEWKSVGELDLATGPIPENLRPLTDDHGQVILRLFLDYSRMRLFELELPQPIGIRATVNGKEPGVAATEADGAIVIQDGAFLCGIYYAAPGDDRLLHVGDLAGTEPLKRDEPPMWDLKYDATRRVLDTIPNRLERVRPYAETVADRMVLNGKEIRRWIDLESLRSGYLPVGSGSVVEIDASADDDRRSLSFLPGGSTLGIKVLWLDGTEGILTVNAPGRLAARIEAVPNYRLTPEGQRAEKLVYLVLAEIPEAVVEFAVVTSATFVGGPAVGAVVHCGVKAYDWITFGWDLGKLIVDSPNARLILLHSQFTLTHDAEGNEILDVTEGRPQLVLQGEDPIDVPAGQRLIRPREGAPRLEPSSGGTSSAKRLSQAMSEYAVKPASTIVRPPLRPQAGDTQALERLCDDLLAGRGTTDSLSVVSSLAADGPAWLWTVLGICYETGRETPRMPTRAASCYRKAADKNDPWGQYRLGLWLLNHANSKEGKPEDDHLASFEWFEKSARNGYSAAVHRLGLCHREGLGTPKDSTRAYSLFLEAAERGYAPSQFTVGEHHLFGIEVKEDRSAAHAWFLRAAEQGHAQAEYFTFFCSDNRGSGTNDYLWLTRAARHGLADAQEALAREILAGKQTRESVLDAAHWLERAARSGNGTAAERLGDVLVSDKPLSRNPQAALDWYRKALTVQQKALGEIASQLLDGLQDKIRRLETEQQAK